MGADSWGSGSGDGESVMDRVGVVENDRWVASGWASGVGLKDGVGTAKGRAPLGSVALESTDLTVTKIWSGRRSRALWRGGTCSSSSRWTIGREVRGTPASIGIVLRIEGAPIFVGFGCGMGSGWKVVLLEDD
ncbi:hypothetical protein F0562_018428 [Nyssa sinensis]|uniref:Uncharacterized protein n=1 Tax=Nyssa sinensis TaxID=561372 RepID=A0A5J4ZC32_9ASTE|nr:hypothetical protein F0562_018428 [Nyssa sinensis]